MKEDVLISEACLEFGAGNRYIKELLKDLHNTKRIVIEYKEVWNPVAYNEQQILEGGIYDGNSTTAKT